MFLEKSESVLQDDLLYITENYSSISDLCVMPSQLSLTCDYSLPFSFKTNFNTCLFRCAVLTPRLFPWKLCMFVAGRDVKVKSWVASFYLSWWTPAILRCWINEHLPTTLYQTLCSTNAYI